MKDLLDRSLSLYGPRIHGVSIDDSQVHEVRIGDTLLCIWKIFHILFSEKPGKPDAPEIVKIHKNAVALKWKPPKDDGGAEITNYVIEYRIEGISYLFHNDEN